MKNTIRAFSFFLLCLLSLVFLANLFSPISLHISSATTVTMTQTASATDIAGSSSFTLVFSSTVTVGDILVLVIDQNASAPISQISDGLSNSFSPDGYFNDGRMSVFISTVGTGGSTDNIVITSTCSINCFQSAIGFDLTGATTYGLISYYGQCSLTGCSGLAAVTSQPLYYTAVGGSATICATVPQNSALVYPTGLGNHLSGVIGEYSLYGAWAVSDTTINQACTFNLASQSTYDDIGYNFLPSSYAVTSPHVIFETVNANDTGTSITCSILPINAGDSIIVSFASVGAAQLSQISILDTIQNTWTQIGTNSEPGIIQVAWAIGPFSLAYARDNITVYLSGVSGTSNNALQCIDVTGLGSPASDIAYLGGTAATGRINLFAGFSNVLLGPQAFSANPSVIYSSLLFTNASDASLIPAYQYTNLNTQHMNSGVGEFFTQYFFNAYPVQSTAPEFALVGGGTTKGWIQMAIVLPLNPNNVHVTTRTITTTVGVTSIGSQVNTAQPLNFNLNNRSTYQAIAFQQNLVYIFYNSAPYPITINYINIPILSTGGNGSWFIVGIYTATTLNQPFSLQWVQTIDLVANEPLQNFTFAPNQNIPPNSFYSIGLADINITDYCPIGSSLPGWSTTTAISNTTVVNTISTNSGGTTFETSSSIIHTSKQVEGICPTSPAIYYGVGNYSQGYVGADFLNLNVTNVGSSNAGPPQAVLPDFYTDSQILPVLSPIPAIYIIETDNYIHVLQFTTTSTIVQGPYVNAITRLFGNVKVMEGLFVVLVPMIFISITKNSVVVMIFFFIIMVIASPFGLNIIPPYGLVLILLIFITAVTRHS